MSKRSATKRIYTLICEFVSGFVSSFVRKEIQDIVDVYEFDYDGEANLSLATTDEVKDIKWMAKDEIIKLFNEGKLMKILKYFISDK